MIQLIASGWYRPYLPTRGRGTPVSAPDPDGDAESWTGSSNFQDMTSGVTSEGRLDVVADSTIYNGDAYTSYSGGTFLSYADGRTLSYFSAVGDSPEWSE